MPKFIQIIFVYLCLNNYAVFAGKLAPLDVLFHGSVNANIKQFEARAENVRDAKEGKVIFATPSIKLASCFLFKWDDSWIYQFITSKDDNQSNYEVTMLISDKKRFTKLDKGGAIYLLPVQSFSYDQDKGIGIYEWISRKAVMPMTKIQFNSALEAMQTFGVKIYFVDKKQFKQFLALPSEKQAEYLKNLKPAIAHLKN